MYDFKDESSGFGLKKSATSPFAESSMSKDMRNMRYADNMYNECGIDVIDRRINKDKMKVRAHRSNQSY